MSHEITAIMTPERILGALIWQVWAGQLDEGLIDLVRTLPDSFVRGLEGDLDTLVQMARGANLDPAVRESLIAALQGEIQSTLRGMDGSQPAGGLFGLGDQED